MDSARILVVDDDAAIRRVIGQVLRKSGGHEVHSASDGEEALAFLEERGYDWDLVITDLLMPRLDGVGLIRALRERAPQVSSLVLTAHKRDQRVVECLELGAFDYILKPVHVKDLLQTVRRAWARHQRFHGHTDQVEITSEFEGWVELTAPSDFEYVERFQKFTSLLGDVPLAKEERDNIRLAVDELGQNAVEWGNRKDRTKRIHLSYCVFEDRIVLKIEDEGEGFDVEALGDPSANPLEHIMSRLSSGKRVGGYGIFLSKKLVDEVDYSDKGNVVLLTKYFSSNPPESAEADAPS